MAFPLLLVSDLHFSRLTGNNLSVVSVGRSGVSPYACSLWDARWILLIAQHFFRDGRFSLAWHPIPCETVTEKKTIVATKESYYESKINEHIVYPSLLVKISHEIIVYRSHLDSRPLGMDSTPFSFFRWSSSSDRLAW